MGTTYTRQSSFSDGDTINASLFNNEYDQLVSAFSTSGHTHDGTAAEGGPVSVVGPSTGGNITITTSAILPNTTNIIDLGSSTLKFKDIYYTGTITGSGTTVPTTTSSTGSVIYATATGTWTQLTQGSTGQYMTVDSSGYPSWTTLDADLSEILNLSNSTGDIMITNTGGNWSLLTAGTADFLLQMNSSGVPQWASGGFATSGHDHSGTYQPLDTDLTEIAGVANSTGDILYTNASGNWAALSPGATGHAVVSNGTGAAISFQAVAVGAHDHSGTYQPLDQDLSSLAGVTAATGTIIYATGASGTWTNLAAGSNGDLLQVNASGVPNWASGGFATSGHDHSGTYQPLDTDLTEIAGVANATGGMLYTNTSGNWVGLGAGTNAYVLQMNSSGVPVWASGGFATSGHDHSGTYQPLDTDLTELAALANATGDIVYTNASGNWALLNAGSTGQVVTSNGAGTAPSWATTTASDPAGTSVAMAIALGG